jgi:S-adenosyl-L-methionine hydrolase (adenosine-forming)
VKPVTFLSDYGYEDEFAGVCRAMIERIAPGVPVIELGHGVPPQDVRRGAYALEAALPYAPEGVHLAVVDPGVGTSRRPVAVTVEGSGRVLVGPDNGLLSRALDRLGGPAGAVDLARSPFRLEPVSATFHGRDIFAPVAARLALGATLEEAGEGIEPSTLARLPERGTIVADDHLAAHVAYFDRYGNAVLDLHAGGLPDGLFAAGDVVEIEVGGELHRAVFGRTFADVATGGALVYPDASGYVAIAVNRGRADRALGLARDDQVLVRRPR